MPPRISPLKDATQHVISKSDNTCKLEVKFINAVKGRGLFAKRSIDKSDFVVEYRGDMIDDAEAQRRRKLYHSACASFMFAFKWKGKTWCIDASREDGSLGRLVNDDHRHPNCKMKRVDVNGKPHLCLFALNDIKEGDEITYDYGGEDCPWRTEVTNESIPSSLMDNLQAQMDDATGPNSSPQQPILDTYDVPITHLQSMRSQCEKTWAELVPTRNFDTVTNESIPSSLMDNLQAQMDDATGPNSSPQQVTNESIPSSLMDNLQAQMDDATGPNSSPQQVTNESIPSSLMDNLQAQMDDATGPNSSPQQVTNESIPSSLMDNLQAQMDDATGPNSSPQQILPDNQTDDEVVVPRLRRTKSVIIKTAHLEVSPDLYDSTSGSADEYIPDSTSESDSDSDVSLRIGSKPQSLREELDLDSFCDTTTPDIMTLERQSQPSSHQDEEEEEPCSSQDINDNIVVGACKKRGGNRLYDKKHYCLYCSKPYAKMARHLESVHEDKPDVAKALSFPKGSKQRKKHLDFIRNKGNFAHNAAVMECGRGELVPFKRPPKAAQGSEFMHCAYCQALFTRKVLWRHMRTCSLRPGSVKPKPGKNRVQSFCTYALPVPSNVTKQLWGVISAMNPDPVTDIIRRDKVIIDVGQHLLNKGGLSAKNQQCVREKMRELGRLIHNAKKVTSLKKMEDLIDPKKYMETVRAVKATCGYDSETAKFLIPSLANKLGNALVKVSKLLKAQALISNNEEMLKNATEFQEVHQEKWNELISATALRNIREAKWNVPSLMPFTEDIQKMHAHLSQKQDEWYDSLSKGPSAKAWMELAKVCLAQTILFNRRREGEVASMPLAAFSSRDTSDPHEDVDWALSELEKKLCRHFTRVIIRGKRGRPVPILLPPKMLDAFELLVKLREACGILQDNQYMFARPGAMTHFRGSDCIRGFAMACGAKCPNALTSTRLRKHAATLSTVLNMTDTEMDQLANFLGHDIRIHREFYRLPEKTLQLAKISKVLMALEQGRLSEFHGKNLDEIGIDPDGTNKYICLFSAEAVADDSLAPTERSTMLPAACKRQRTPSPQSDELSEKDCSSKPPSKGRGTQKKKTPWQQKEVQAVEKQMSRFITSCIVPNKSDCEKCLKAEPEAVKHRDWRNLKFYVYNRIIAYKRKLQCA
ncbi:uncharacterized protein V6R79_020019 [Siganus canaliculatus]